MAGQLPRRGSSEVTVQLLALWPCATALHGHAWAGNPCCATLDVAPGLDGINQQTLYVAEPIVSQSAARWKRDFSEQFAVLHDPTLRFQVIPEVFFRRSAPPLTNGDPQDFPI